MRLPWRRTPSALPATDITDFRARVAARPLVTLDELDTAPKHVAKNFASDLDAMIDKGWTRDGRHLDSLAPPLPWNEYDRSFSFHLHAWEPLSFLLKGYCVVAEPERRARYFDVSYAFACDWLQTFQRSVLDLEPSEVASEKFAKTAGMAWYDMAVGQRIYRLAFILDVICRDERYSDEEVEFAYRSLTFHQAVISSEGFFNSHSNHGLYQALGQLAASKRFLDIDPDFERHFQLAKTRLAHVLAEHFTPDNVHKEHSPGYHYMVLGSLIGAMQTGLIDDPRLADRIHAMEDALAWMVQPDYRLVTFGDSDPRLLGSRSAPDILLARFSTPAFQAILSHGRGGAFPAPGVVAYKDAGYGFARLNAPDLPPTFENASYLAQIAAFHSRVHKHADHLSFVWHDRNRDILIDPGRYAYAGKTPAGSELNREGFWYSDPRRIYVETTHAHNTVEIDGRSFPRTKVKPFGSALNAAEEQNGLAVTDCEATHLRTVRHRRVLVMRPGHFLLALDWLNDRENEHDYRQWFHFAPDWEAAGRPTGISATSPATESRQALSLQAVSFLPEATLGPVVRGQQEPELLGWMSDKAYSLIPTSTFHVQAPRGRMGRFVTLLALTGPVAIDPAECRSNITLRACRFVWSDDRGRHVLGIADQDGRTIASYTAG